MQRREVEHHSQSRCLPTRQFSACPVDIIRTHGYSMPTSAVSLELARGVTRVIPCESFEGCEICGTTQGPQEHDNGDPGRKDPRGSMFTIQPPYRLHQLPSNQITPPRHQWTTTRATACRATWWHRSPFNDSYEPTTQAPNAMLFDVASCIDDTRLIHS